MSTTPVDVTHHVGQEVTLGELYRAAWRTSRQHFWIAFGLALLSMLMVIGVAVVASCAGSVVAMPLSLILMGTTSGLSGPGDAGFFVLQIVQQVVQQGINALVTGLFTFPLFAGFCWSVVCTYDARRMQAGDLFTGFRTRYATLWRLGLLKGVADALPVILLMGAVMLAMMTAVSGGGPSAGFGVGFAALAVVGGVGVWICTALVLVLFLLTPLFAFVEERPTWKTCLAYNWRTLKARPGRFIAVSLTPMAFGIALSALATVIAIPLVFLGRGGEAGLAIAILLGVVIGLAFICAAIWLAIYWVFLVAALFRSGYGYTLNPPDWSVLSPVPLAAYADAGQGGYGAPPAAPPTPYTTPQAPPPAAPPPTADEPFHLPGDEPPEHSGEAPADEPPKPLPWSWDPPAPPRDGQQGPEPPQETDGAERPS